MSVIGIQLSDYINVSHVRHSNSRSRLGRLALLLALVSRWKVRQANVPMRGGRYSVRAALCITFVFAQWCGFEATSCPRHQNGERR